MGFESLLGNERLKDNLIQSLRRGRLSHFYLISGARGSGRHTLARLLAAALQCKDQTLCGTCSGCRKVLNGQHPDFITVDDPEKKTVPVDLIRQARSDMYIQPNEGRKKIYLFPRAQDMGIPGQNALLKVLEEPPKYGVFILLTDNPEKLLPTVRSRCTELSLQALPEALLLRQLKQSFPQAEEETLQAAVARSGGYLGQAMDMLSGDDSQPPQTEEFVRAFTSRNPTALLQVLVPMEKWKRDQLADMLLRWQELLESALVARSGLTAISPMARQLSTARSSADLMRAINHLKKAIEYTQGNVSPAAVCGFLEWALRK